MQSYEKTTNEALNLIVQLVEEFIEADETFDLTKILIFLSVALHDGVEAQTISKNFDIPKTTMSKHIRSMSPLGYRKDKDGTRVAGSGLLVQEPSLQDLRAKNLYLTFDGKVLVDRLTKIIFNSMSQVMYNRLETRNKTQ